MNFKAIDQNILDICGQSDFVDLEKCGPRLVTNPHLLLECRSTILSYSIPILMQLLFEKYPCQIKADNLSLYAANFKDNQFISSNRFVTVLKNGNIWQYRTENFSIWQKASVLTVTVSYCRVVSGRNHVTFTC